MNKKWITIMGSGILAVGIAGAGIGFANSDRMEVTGGTIQIHNQTEAEFPDLAKITIDQADRYALGQILKTGLEDENGFLVYGVEVVTADKIIMEVKVDAGSGKVLAAERDTPDKNEEDDENGDNED